MQSNMEVPIIPIGTTRVYEGTATGTTSDTGNLIPNPSVSLADKIILCAYSQTAANSFASVCKRYQDGSLMFHITKYDGTPVVSETATVIYYYMNI